MTARCCIVARNHFTVKIEYRDCYWWLISDGNGVEESTEVVFCPWCGVRLDDFYGPMGEGHRKGAVPVPDSGAI